MIKMSASRIWKVINAFYVNKRAMNNLTNFKSEPMNYKIALWSPKNNGIRYLKTLIYNLCKSFTIEQFEMLKNIKNRNYGNPLTIIYKKERIDLDYIRTVKEIDAVKHLSFDSVTEIGAGYGRTCHAFLSNLSIKEYRIVDLPNCLLLAQKYLKVVLTKNQFSKVRFMDKIQGKSDLCVNIDSFSEMNPESVIEYIQYVHDNCKYFYVNNPMCDNIGTSPDSSNISNIICKTIFGDVVLPETMDIFDIDMIWDKRYDFVYTYKPTNWKCVMVEPVMWTNYLQALYVK